MKDYHFQENDQDFGLTVRLDDINEKVKQLKKADIEDELGDANDFLKAFESEKFDTLPEEMPEKTGMYRREQLMAAARTTTAHTPTESLAGGIMMAMNIP